MESNNSNNNAQKTLDALNNINTNKNMTDKAFYVGIERVFSICSFVISAIFMCIGFYKMFVYDEGDSYGFDSVNAYVGGDAYNYIINGTYATAYFVLMGVFLLAGVGLLILEAVKNSKK